MASLTEFRTFVLSRYQGGDSIETAVRSALTELGPVRACRVSSVKARRPAAAFRYWGAVRYYVRLTRDGHITSSAAGRASLDRRSRQFAERDCARMAARDDAICGVPIGRLSADELASLAGIEAAS